MSVSRILAVRHLIDEYKRFLGTSHRFLDPDLRKQFNEHFSRANVVVRGPFVTLTRDFAQSGSMPSSPLRCRDRSREIGIRMALGARSQRQAGSFASVLFPYGLPELRLVLRSRGGVDVDIAIEVQIHFFENRNEGFDVIVARLPRGRQ